MFREPPVTVQTKLEKLSKGFQVENSMQIGFLGTQLMPKDVWMESRLQGGMTPSFTGWIPMEMQAYQM